MMQDNHWLSLSLSDVLEYWIRQKLTIVNKQRVIRTRSAFEKSANLFIAGLYIGSNTEQ